MPDLTGLLSPARVAVIGASDEPGSVGRALVENLTAFDGEVVLVNPNRDTILDRPSYPEIGAVPDPGTVDLAVIAVPPTAVTTVLEQVGAADIHNVIVITAGFSEAGDTGADREAALVEIAETYEMNLLGPNCVGLISTPSGLNTTFARGDPPSGSISLVSQSGAFIAAVLGWAAQHGVGFKDVVSLGNEAVLDEVDFLEAWGADPDTDVILAYIEDVEDGARFIHTAREVTAHTPVVAIKAGRSEAGAAAVASHTGSIAGSDAAYDAGFAQAGVQRVDTIQAIFDTGQILAGQPLLDTDAIAVVTNGGGPGVITTDAVAASRLELAPFDTALETALSDRLPAAVDIANPLDLIGDADVDRFETALGTVLAADDVGGAIVLCVPTATIDFDALAATIGEVQAAHGTPVVTCLMGGADADRAADTLEDYGIPNYFDPARAVTSLTALATQRDVQARTYETPRRFDVDTATAATVLAQARDRDAHNLGVEATPLLDAYGIPTPASEIVDSARAARRFATDRGEGIVMKIVSPDIIHKSDIGGVEVDVDPADVEATYHTLIDRAREHDPDAAILGVQVQALVAPAESTETIVGVNRDPQFGHLVLFGLGGIFVEIFEDTAFRVAPVTDRDAHEMIDAIQAAPMLHGARGRTPADTDAVAETIQRVSQLVTDFPAITELDINPLVVSPDGVQAIDLRLTVDPDALDLD